MNAAIWIGLLVDVALLVWVIILVNEIKGAIKEIKESINEVKGSIPDMKGYLRRIALSQPVSPDQMRLINQSITAKEAMEMFEKAGGQIVCFSDAVRFRTSPVEYAGDPEILRILKNRESEVTDILNAKQNSNP